MNNQPLADSRYFYDYDLFYDADELLDSRWGESDGPSNPDDWPVTVYPEKTVYPDLCCKDFCKQIIKRLVEDHLATQDKILGRHRSRCSGPQVVEWAMEEYYGNCDWYDGPSTTAMTSIRKAESIAQDAIDWWLFWNAGFIRMFAYWQGWRPEDWSIGATVIEQALEKAELELRGIDLYVMPDKDKPVFWEYPTND